MTQQLINVGTVGNDGTGDTARLAWQKGNANFTDLYTQLAAYGTAYVGTFVATAGQTVFTLPLSPGTVANLQISVDGAMMVPGLDYYWTTPVTVTFYVGLNVGQTVLYRYNSYVTIGTMTAGGGISGQLLYNNAGIVNGTTIGGDATLVATTGALTVTKTAGVAFAASATTDTTNAANISSGILPVARQSYTQGGTGSVARTVTNKLQESVSVVDFGADPTGVADSTAAIQAAINAVSSGNGPSVLLFVGTFTYNPSSLTYSGATHKVTWLVEGTLKPTTTIILTSSFEIIGLGGATFGAVAFVLGSCCGIVAPAGSIPVIKTQGAADHVLKNIIINGCYQGLYLDGASSLGALSRFENVNILCETAGGTPLVIDAFFWAWFVNCKFNTTTVPTKSILITNTSTAYSQSGLIYFTDCITSGRGISVNPSVGYCGSIYFKNHTHESLPVGEDFFYAQSNSNNITFDKLELADTVVGAGYTFDLAGVVGFRLMNSSPQSFRNLPARMISETDNFFNNSDTTYNVGTGSANSSAQYKGAFHGRLLSRGHIATAPVGIGTAIAVTVPTGTSSGIVFTGGQTALDSSATAYKIVSATPGSGGTQGKNIYQVGTALNTGDYVILYSMVKMLDSTTGGGPGNGILGLMWNTGSVVLISNQGRTATEAAPAGPDQALADTGWMPCICAFRAAETATHDLIVATLVSDASAGYLIWKPNVRIIPASYGFTDQDCIRLINSYGAMHNANSGVISVMEHQTTRTGLNITASRPAAATVGKGAQFYDTTLGLPIWSDGTNWRNAAGTIV